MPQPVIYEPALLHPEQKKPWERREGEPARWYWRFRSYLNLGSKRSINAASEVEREGKSRTNAGPEWYKAAKRYQWQERADAYDREQSEQNAYLMRQIAMKCSFVSRPYRITQLNSIAETLARELEKGHDPVTFMAMIRQMQSLMQNIIEEVTAWDITLDASCDAAAFEALQQKDKRMSELAQEREMIAEEEADFKLQQMLQQREMMKQHQQMMAKLLGDVKS